MRLCAMALFICYSSGIFSKDSTRQHSFQAGVLYDFLRGQGGVFPGIYLDYTVPSQKKAGLHMGYSFYPNYSVQTWEGVGTYRMMNSAHQWFIGPQFRLFDAPKKRLDFGLDIFFEYRHVRTWKYSDSAMVDYFPTSRYPLKIRTGIYLQYTCKRWKLAVGYGQFNFKLGYAL
jgi:hypothetical protein